MNPLISIVVPVYQAEATLDELIGRLDRSLCNLSSRIEVILIDDGSVDSTWSIIKKITEEYTFIKAYRLSRNFGQHNAIVAGLEATQGDWIVVMDCDLQDRPEAIPQLFKKALEGYDIVLARRKNRQDSKFKILTSILFYKVFDKISGLTFEKGVGNFGIYNKKVIKAVLSYRENFRPFAIIVKVVGFNTATIDVEHNKRFSGKSNYRSFGLLKGALNAIIYYSNRPIWIFLMVGLGMISLILFLLLGMFFMIFNIDVMDLVLILIVLMSILSMNTALIGIYVSRIFIESKNRPLYIVDEHL